MERPAEIVYQFADEHGEDEVIEDTVKACKKPWQESLEPVEEGSGVGETLGPGKILEALQFIVDIVYGFLYEGITHWNLDPDCVSIMRSRSLCDPEVPHLRPGLSEEAIRKATEELCHEHVTHADDIIFALGCLLFFCVTGGKDPFGVDDDSRPRKILKNNPDLSAVEHISGATKKHADLSALEHIPEAMDLISTLLDPEPDNRDSVDWQNARVDEALRHPLFWPDDIKLRFLFEAGLKVKRRSGTLLEAVASVASVALCGRNDESNNVDKVPSLLRKLQQDYYPCYYHIEVLDVDESELEDELVRYYMSSYPRLFFEVYKVMRTHDDLFITDFLRKYIF